MNKQINLEEISDAVRNADTIESHIENFKNLTETNNIKIAVYHCLPPRGTEQNHPISLISWAQGTTDWTRKYEKEKLYRTNPFVNLSLSHAKCLLWSSIRRHPSLSARERTFVEMSKEHYPGEGLSMPLYGPTGHNGNVCIRYTKKNYTLSCAEILKIQMIHQQSHVRLCNLLSRRDSEDLNLTSRETEVLEWVMVGKSNSVIADIMGLSKHTIDSYMRHLFIKLGVSDRVTAALRGLAVGAVR